jgi:hypothetical protein
VSADNFIIAKKIGNNSARAEQLLSHITSRQALKIVSSKLFLSNLMDANPKIYQVTNHL